MSAVPFSLRLDAELRSRLATSAKEYVRREHTPQAARRKLEAFYAIMENQVQEHHA